MPNLITEGEGVQKQTKSDYVICERPLRRATSTSVYSISRQNKVGNMDFFLTKLEDCFISTITAVFPPHCSDAESRRAVMKHISRHSVDIILYCLHYCQFSISVLVFRLKMCFIMVYNDCAPPQRDRNATIQFSNQLNQPIMSCLGTMDFCGE